jgi:muconate cycloisomerase
MHIRRLTAFVVRLPLRRPFVHAAATRQESENLLVRCELADGTIGWGEGVPRNYVTGETPDGCMAQLKATPIGAQLSVDCEGWHDVLSLCERFSPAVMCDDPRGCYGNALRCAVELSVLDAFGRLFGEPVSIAACHFAPAKSVLATPTKSRIHYSAVIGAGDKRLVRQAVARRIYGFRRCKVKVGAEGDDDAKRLRTVRRCLGRAVDVYIDANGAWHADELLSKLRPLELLASCIEQPLPHAEVAALAELRPELPMQVMLDDSLTSEADARAAIDSRLCDVFNLRLSKCGGYLACLRLAATARNAGSMGNPSGPIGYHLGCHPGETGILSAAGRHWACSVDHLPCPEGSYDRYLFDRLITNEDITFGYGGRAPALAGPGLGVTIDPAALADVTVTRQEFTVE